MRLFLDRGVGLDSLVEALVGGAPSRDPDEARSSEMKPISRARAQEASPRLGCLGHAHAHAHAVTFFESEIWWTHTLSLQWFVRM